MVDGPEPPARTRVGVGGQKLTEGELIERLVARVHRLEDEVARLVVRVTELEAASGTRQ